jgi:hypothetical protein
MLFPNVFCGNITKIEALLFMVQQEFDCGTKRTPLISAESDVERVDVKCTRVLAWHVGELKSEKGSS